MPSSRPKSGGRAFDRSLVVVEALVGLAVVGALIGKAYGAAPALFFMLSGAAAGFTGWVIVRMAGALRDPTLDVTGRQIDEEREALEHEKLLLLQGIKELEADAAVGKVDAADYQHLRSTAERRAAEIIKVLRKSDERWLAEAERLVLARLGGAAAGKKNGASAGDRGLFARLSPEEETAAWAKESKDARRGRTAFAGLFGAEPAVFEARGEGLSTCSRCGTVNEDDARYCVGCGRPRAVFEARVEGRP